jgi:hypothetical protein
LSTRSEEKQIEKTHPVKLLLPSVPLIPHLLELLIRMLDHVLAYPTLIPTRLALEELFAHQFDWVLRRVVEEASEGGLAGRDPDGSRGVRVLREEGLVEGQRAEFDAAENVFVVVNTGLFALQTGKRGN